MSRVGKNSVTIPAGVEVQISPSEIVAKGKFGEQRIAVSNQVSVQRAENQLTVVPIDKSKMARTHWGTYRSLVNNLVKGVSEGFTVNLEINGVGYRAAVQGNELILQLGFSHEVKFAIPEGITIKCEKPTALSIHGASKQVVGQVASKIRGFRPPEPYKGKGIRYEKEYILRKEGKKK
jgi:large subunit ribosomal protein L6